MKKHLILLASGLLLVSGVAYTADTQTFAANLTATESTASNDTSPELFANSYSVSGNTITIDVIPSKRRGEGMGFYGLTINLAMSLAKSCTRSCGFQRTHNHRQCSGRKLYSGHCFTYLQQYNTEPDRCKYQMHSGYTDQYDHHRNKRRIQRTEQL